MPYRKALIVIDMQNDYLWEKRKKMFNYDTATLTAEVNSAIARYKEDGAFIIYVAQIFPNIPTNKLFIGFSIDGTEGAKFYNGMDVVSDLYFEKKFPNSFTAKKFKAHMKEMDYSEITVCGLDLCGCVGSTALGAVKVCSNVSLIDKATGTRFKDKKVASMKQKLMKAGVRII